MRKYATKLQINIHGSHADQILIHVSGDNIDFMKVIDLLNLFCFILILKDNHQLTKVCTKPIHPRHFLWFPLSTL